MKQVLSVCLTTLRAIGLIVGIAVLVFVMVRVLPGDVVDLMAVEGGISDVQKEQLRQELGLGQSIPAQFAAWVRQAVQGDLGHSLRFHQSIKDMVIEALPPTFYLAGTSFLLGLLLGGLVAVLALIWPKSFFPNLVEAINLWSIAMPTFCAGLLGIFVFVFWLGWMPLLGNMVVPVLVLGVDVAGQMIKPLYEDLKETVNAKYVLTARAKGLSRTKIVFFHILPNSLAVVLALSGVILGGLVGGTITMEVLFGLPGIGKLSLDAVVGRDYPLLQAVIVFIALAVVCINWVTDLLARLIDPRPVKGESWP